MCGILGSFSQHLSPGLDVRLQAALRALDHRGPDDRGLEIFSVAHGQLTLGHTRLSIIDLSPGGHQPMHSPDGRYTIVFNGEIYNYRELRQELRSLGYSFHTESDTEVLLAVWDAWKEGGLRRLAGMFAFAVFDRQDLTVTLVRDAFGIKPLFYYVRGGELFFASELPALLAMMPHRPGPNLQQAYDYLVYGRYDDQAETFYEGILHLPPGHTLKLSLAALSEGAEPVRWWWPSIKERTDLSFEHAAEALREHFLSNVSLHLRSDVPLGAALSGGVDSSAVVCAMRHLEPDAPIHTFSYVARGSAVDEEHWVDLVNAHVGAIPHKVIVSHDELAADLDDMIRAQGEPFGSTSIYAQYRVFRAAREAGITVTLDGQGADELLAGYNRYPVAATRSLLQRRDVAGLVRFFMYWAQWPGRSRAQAVMALLHNFVPACLRGMAHRAIGRTPEPVWLKSNWLREHGVQVGPPKKLPGEDDSHGRSLMATLRAQLNGGMSSLLRHGDRDSMRWSLESRVPFLTTDIAEFVLQLPEEYLLSSHGETKCPLTRHAWYCS